MALPFTSSNILELIIYNSISDGTGLLFTEQGLDYETTPFYNLSIVAHDLGNPALYAETYVLVNVTDVQDEVPQFGQDVYNVVIQDSVAPGSEVFHLRAGPGEFTYEILGGYQCSITDHCVFLNITYSSLYQILPNNSTFDNYIHKNAIFLQVAI